MRQRNDTGYVQHVSTWPEEGGDGPGPSVVGPGEVTDEYPELLAGFTDVTPEPAPDPKPVRKSAAPAPATPEGGDPA